MNGDFKRSFQLTKECWFWVRVSRLGTLHPDGYYGNWEGATSPLKRDGVQEGIAAARKRNLVTSKDNWILTDLGRALANLTL